MAHAFCHIGVFERLAEAGISLDRFDTVCGVSGGAIAVTLLACGISPPQLREIARREICCSGIIKRIPCVTLAHLLYLFRNRLRTTLEKYCRGVNLEELHPRILIPSFDIGAGQPFVHQHGDCIVAALSSCAIPIIARPVQWEGRILVDGSFYTNLPVYAIERHAPAQSYIGVDVSRRGSGVRCQRKVKGPLRMFRVVMESQWRQIESEQRRRCEVLVRPENPGSSMFDFSRESFDRLVGLGRAAAAEALAAIKRILDGNQVECGVSSTI
jgi:predicted acylesterase/phospholipase RssA